MPTIAIYRENTLIWSKEFEESETGHYDLGSDSVECQKGDIVFISWPLLDGRYGFTGALEVEEPIKGKVFVVPAALKPPILDAPLFMKGDWDANDDDLPGK